MTREWLAVLETFAQFGPEGTRIACVAVGVRGDDVEEAQRHLADVIAARAPGESMLAAIRRDYAEAVARADVTLGLSSPGFARMILSSPVLVSRVREMLDQREQALGDAIAAETGPTIRSSGSWQPFSPPCTAC